MPELPEVETIVRGLNKAIIGRQIRSIKVNVSKLFIGDSKKLVGLKVKNIIRRGKNILIQLDNNLTLAIHLKMTGQLIFLERKMTINNYKLIINNSNPSIDGLVGGHPDKLYNQPLPHKHTHIIIEFSDGSTLYYNDLRKFGWWKIAQNYELRITNQGDIKPRNSDFILLNSLGIDALSKDLTSDYLYNIVKNRKTTIKQILLDQKVIAGIGNIYADEILFCAKIYPKKKASELTRKHVNMIVECIPQVLQKAITAGGTSSSDYRKIDGSKGGYLDLAWVYGREGKPCQVCQTPIKRIKVGQRSSHYCDNCQG